MFGLISGVIITLLFTTKKGRKILQVLTDEGFDKLGKWEGIVKDVTSALNESEKIDTDDYMAAMDSSDTNERFESEELTGKPDEGVTQQHTPSKSRRFFRGARRKN